MLLGVGLEGAGEDLEVVDDGGGAGFEPGFFDRRCRKCGEDAEDEDDHGEWEQRETGRASEAPGGVTGGA